MKINGEEVATSEPTVKDPTEEKNGDPVVEATSVEEKTTPQSEQSNQSSEDQSDPSSSEESSSDGNSSDPSSDYDSENNQKESSDEKTEKVEKAEPIKEEQPDGEVENEEKPKVLKKRGRKRKPKEEPNSDSDAEEAQPQRRRKRRKKKEVELDEDGNPIKKKRGRKPKKKEPKPEKPDTRHKLRKIIEKLDEKTMKAEEAEKERRERLEEIEKQEKIAAEKDTSEQLVLQHEPRVYVDAKIAKKLKPHQNEGIKFMYANMVETVAKSLESNGEGSHCMGLGKTIQTLSFLQSVLCAEPLTWCKSALILCPMNTLHNWLRELSEWLDYLGRRELKTFSLNDAPTPKERVHVLQNWQDQGGIMVMGYDMYRLLASGSRTRVARYKKIQKSALVDPGPDIIICDEGHLLKNSEAAIAKTLAGIRTRRRCVLTGTPLQNNLIEYHCMASFVKPDLLGSLKEFRNRFVNPILNGQHADSTQYDVTIMKRRAHVLHNLLSGCVQRKDYQVLAKHLPEKHEYIISVRLTPFQRELYSYYLENMSTKGEKGENARGKVVSGLFTDYQNLMRVWTHPKLLETHSLKREFAELLIEKEEAEEDYEEMNQNINSDDEEIAILEDDDPGLNSTDDENEDSKFFGDDAPLIVGMADDPPEESQSNANNRKMSRSERHRNRNKALNGESNGDGGDELMTLESAARNERDWWSHLSVGRDLNGLHHSSKIQILLELLRVCEERQEKLLVFSQSLLSLDLIEEFLLQCTNLVNEGLPSPAGRGKWEKNVDYFRMDGATSGMKRHEFIGSFNEANNLRARLFMISTKAGCLGVNLVAATRVVIFDASWNPTHDIQSIFRVYRIGQTKPVYIYRLVAQGTMEEKVYRRQVQKQGLAQRVLDEQQVGRFFSSGDLKELYMFECDETPEKEDDGGKRFKKPKDVIFADLLYQGNWSRRIAKYHEHDSLLDHIESEELTPEERAAAWAEYENERVTGYTTMQQHQQAQQQQELLLKQAAQQQALARQQALLKQQQEKANKKLAAKLSRAQQLPSTSANPLMSTAGGSADATNAFTQFTILYQTLQQRAIELDKAKTEAENAGAGDQSLDSMRTEDLVEKMAESPLYAALGREELKKIAAAALSETQKQRDKARKKLETAIKNFSLIQTSFQQTVQQLQTLVLLQQNPQLALFNQLAGGGGGSSLNSSSDATSQAALLELLSQFTQNQ